MASTKPRQAASVEEYLASLPDDRRSAIETVRAAILRKLPEGYVETMQYGMISYVVPHSIFPAGYHCDPKQPLNFASIGSQKNHMVIHMLCVYMNPPLQQTLADGFKAAGKKLDMGKGCLRFKKVDDLAVDVLGKVVASLPVKKYLASYEAAMGSRLKKKPTTPAKSATATKASKTPRRAAAARKA